MADVAVVVELTRLQEAREILRELYLVLSKEFPWPVTLRINLLDFSKRHRRYQTGSPSLRPTEEALGLLMMLRHLNYEEWVAHVQAIWPDIPREQLSRDGTSHETFGISILIGVDHGFAELQHCHGQRQALGQSDAYQQVLQLVQDLNQAQGTIDPLYVFYERRSGCTEERIQHRSSAVPNVLDATGGVEELGELAAFQEQGCVVYPFRLGSCQIPQAKFRPQLLTVLQQLFTVSSDTQLQAQGVKYLTISNSTPSYWIPALLSAAHSSKSLKSIKVESTFAELRENKRLLWIAYAVFRRQHQPLQLTLNCSDIEPSDIEAIQRIVTAEDPLAELIGSDVTSAAIDIRATRFHLADSTSSISGADAKDVYTSNYPLSVRAVQASVDGDGPTHVLLPGYGKAWVAPEDVLDTGLELGSLADVTLPEFIGVKSITASSDSTMALLRVVMSGATHLAVGFSDGVSADYVDSWLHQLLTISTDLQELQIKARAMRSLDVLLEGFSTRALRLKKLVIENIVSGDGDHVLRFFDALGDRQHSIADQLQQLEMTAVVDSIQGYDFGESIQRMLRLNRCLTVFKIRICTLRGLQKIPADAYDRIREAAGDETLTISLAMKNKAAFLSVVVSSSSSV